MDLNRGLALKALSRLDQLMSNARETRVQLIVGGGGAMILQYGYEGLTEDIDAVPVLSEFEQLRPYMERVAQELKIAGDWLNPYYQAFTIYLPKDVKTRLTNVFTGDVLSVSALGAEDLLIMKLMAGRAKDVGHIRHLLEIKALKLSVVERRLNELKALYPKLAEEALDRFDEYQEEA